MSKIGRKPIDISGMTVEIKGEEIHYKGKKSSGMYVIPSILTAHKHEGKLFLTLSHNTSTGRMAWGLHRALLFNALKGSDVGFEKQLKIVGLGFKAALAGSKLVFSLGYSHKVDIDLPADVSVVIDKTGQLMTFKSSNKTLLGHLCSKVRALRKPEPYKGTGIQYVDEVILRKAGKTSSK